jgi:acetyl esterase/lipase
VKLSERVIPVPRSISPEAQAGLSAAVERGRLLGDTPALGDVAGWHKLIAKMNADSVAMLSPFTATMKGRVETRTMGGVTVYVAEPDDMPDRNRDKALLFFHGGGLVIYGGEPTRHMTLIEAMTMRCKVFGVDYRNPPEHPYPAALDDCVAVYRELLKTYKPDQIVMTGTSGGGNLAGAVPLKVRDLGLPLPAAVGLFSPEVDLTESGDTFKTNQDIDVVLVGGLMPLNQLYAGGADLTQPYLSPLFGDFTKGFPPAFVQAGTRDVLLSNSVRFHRALRKAGIQAELHVWEAMPHVAFGGAPEDAEPAQEFSKFLAKVAGWASP